MIGAYGGTYPGGDFNPLNWWSYLTRDTSTAPEPIPEIGGETSTPAPASPGQPAPAPSYTSPVRVEEIAPEALPTPSGATPIAQQGFPTWAKILLGLGAFAVVVSGAFGVRAVARPKRRRRRRRRR